VNGHETNTREALTAFRTSLSRSLRVAMPALVEAYTPATAMADVRPVHRIIQTVGGEDVEIDPPLISRCPVVMPVCGPFFTSWPLAVGDEVLLVICDRELDTWLYSGETTTPRSHRAHQLTDAVVIPGLSSFANPVTGRSATDMVMGLQTGAGSLRVTPAGVATLDGSAVKLGASAALAVARSTDPVAITMTATPGSFGAWVTAVTAALNTLAPGSAVAPASVTGTITAGSAKVTAE
jgi:hypothetical protein